MKLAISYVITLSFSIQVLAGALAPAPHQDREAQRAVMQIRQVPKPSSSVGSISSRETITTTVFYWDSEQTSDGTIKTRWAPFEYTLSPYSYMTTVDDYFKWLLYSYKYVTVFPSSGGTSYSEYYTSVGLNTNTMWTDCNDGTMTGTLVSGTTSSLCGYEGYMCVTFKLRSEFGISTGGLTSFACAYNDTARPLLSETILYEKHPDSTGLTSATATTTAGSMSTTVSASPGSSPSSISSPTISPSATPSGGGGSSNNIGVIAGSVVGGVAVLAIAGVAVLWILKRNKRHPDTPYTTTSHNPAPYYPPLFQADKAPGLHSGYSEQRMSEVPEYVPQASPVGYGNNGYPGTSPNTMPHPHSPVPVYPEGYRGELSGVRSPAP